MFILDAPYASPVLQDWLVAHNHPVLKNDFSLRLREEGSTLNLVDAADAVARINAGERVCTNSENALEWISGNCDNALLSKGISVCKDKELMRQVLKPLDESLYFRGCTYEELLKVSYEDVPERLIVKPTVGFCSLGVYAVENQADWDNALAAIESDIARWNDLYPESVVGGSRFILEEMIDGQEYALDMFYDEQGAPVIINTFQHDFASATDTSDRLYWCSADLEAKTSELFVPWLVRANELMGLKDFCIHIELRVNETGIHVIELNPLRFAGLGGTDLSLYAKGMLAYDAYLSHEEAKGFVNDSRFVMSVLMPEASVPTDASFDYDSFMANLSNVLEMRKFERAKMSAFGFMFLSVPNGEVGDTELSFILNEPLEPYII